MKVPLEVDFTRAAVLAIDIHRGRLDPLVATMPADTEVAARVVAANKVFIEAMWQAGVPIIYSVLESRAIPGLGRDALANTFRAAVVDAGVELAAHTHTDLRHHNLEGGMKAYDCRFPCPLSCAGTFEYACQNP